MPAAQQWAAPDVCEAYQVCQQITKREVKNFYYGFISLPEPERHAIYAAYAFSRQCDDAVDGLGSDAEKLRALTSAKQHLYQCYAGQPADNPGEDQLTAWLWFWGLTSEAIASCLGLSPAL